MKNKNGHVLFFWKLQVPLWDHLIHLKTLLIILRQKQIRRRNTMIPYLLECLETVDTQLKYFPS